MAAITDPLVAAGMAAAIGFAAISLFPRAECEASDMDAKIVRFLLGPLCLAVLILVLDGVADRFYPVGLLHP